MMPWALVFAADMAAGLAPERKNLRRKEMMGDCVPATYLQMYIAHCFCIGFGWFMYESDVIAVAADRFAVNAGNGMTR